METQNSSGRELLKRAATTKAVSVKLLSDDLSVVINVVGIDIQLTSDGVGTQVRIFSRLNSTLL